MKLLCFDQERTKVKPEIFKRLAETRFIAVCYDEKTKKWEMYSNDMCHYQAAYALNLALAYVMALDDISN